MPVISAETRVACARRPSRRIRLGTVDIGGGAPISIQSMTITKTEDVGATLIQVHALATQGADIVRVAVPHEGDARALPAIVAQAGVPIVADIHFPYRIALLVLAGMALYKTGIDLLGRHRDLANRVIDGLNGVLFVVIVLELMSTVVAHFEHAGFQLQPFLIIGIISGVRHILTVGARLSLAGEVTGRAFRQSQIELGVEAAVVLGLGLALFLVRLREQTQPGE